MGHFAGGAASTILARAYAAKAALVLALEADGGSRHLIASPFQMRGRSR
jgi:hypothetical protein